MICWNNQIRERDKLVTDNLKLVWSMVHKLMRRSDVQALGEDEAYAVGNLTLTRCAERFDPSLGFQFSTYACCSIKSDILRAAQKHKKHSRCMPWYYSDGEKRDIDIAAPVKRESLDHDEDMLPQLLGRLPQRWREAVAMKFGLDGQPEMVYRDIGLALGVSDKRAQQIVTKAIAWMRT